MKPCSEACERNREPILEVLRQVLPEKGTLLEIASGTGQHAVHFGAAFPRLTWLTSELPQQHDAIRIWLEEAQLPNVRPPLALDVHQPTWPVARVDAVFAANLLHILSWEGVQRLFDGVGPVLAPKGVLCVYGPFNYGGNYTSDSNARFDGWLKARDPRAGIRDFEAVEALARRGGLSLFRDVAMPANNRTLVWRKVSAE